MVDVGDKAVTARTATAQGRLVVNAEVSAVARPADRKGDALGVARIAGIMAAKRVPDLIPLCHQIALSGVKVISTLSSAAVTITAPRRPPIAPGWRWKRSLRWRSPDWRCTT